MRVFITGASGWIGSAVVPELIGAGHQVVGLARSEASAEALAAAGAEVRRGSLDDLDVLREAAAEADGVLHLAFKHDIAFSGDFQGATDADRRAIDAFGDALAGSGKPFVIASGLLGLAPGRVATEEDGQSAGPDAPAEGPGGRQDNALATIALASRNVRSSVVRLPPTVHGDGDQGFVASLIANAREKGVSGYVGDGPGAGRPCTARTPPTCSGWPWRTPRPAPRCTRRPRRASRCGPWPRPSAATSASPWSPSRPRTRPGTSAG